MSAKSPIVQGDTDVREIDYRTGGNPDVREIPTVLWETDVREIAYRTGEPLIPAKISSPNGLPCSLSFKILE